MIPEPAVLEIQRPGDRHLVEIATRRRHHGKTQERAIDRRILTRLFSVF